MRVIDNIWNNQQSSATIMCAPFVITFAHTDSIVIHSVMHVLIVLLWYIIWTKSIRKLTIDAVDFNTACGCYISLSVGYVMWWVLLHIIAIKKERKKGKIPWSGVELHLNRMWLWFCMALFSFQFNYLQNT